MIKNKLPFDTSADEENARERFLHSIRQLANIAILIRHHDDGRYESLYVSEEYAAIMDNTVEETLRQMDGHNYKETTHIDDRPLVDFMLKNHHAPDGGANIQIRKITAKGKIVWCNAHFAFIDYLGEHYVYITYFDITEMKKREQIAEVARRERESIRILHDMLNSGPWYMYFDEQGKMTGVTWSNTFRKMLGYKSTEDFPDTLESWSDLLHEDDKARVLKEYHDTIADYSGKKNYDVEYRLLTKDRGWRWFHAIGQLSRRPDGSPITYVGMFVDITEKRAMEQKLVERETTLKNALKEAKQANVAKTAFLSSMSHEIRTPMNAIIGLDNIALKEPNLAPRTRDHLEKIGASARHLLSLINDILDMSRIESGRMVLKNEEFSFRAILEQINTMIGAQCRDRKLIYAPNIIGEIDEYYIGDDMKLKQVLINILGNAVKFTPAGGTITFLIEKTRQFDDKSTLRFIIRDTGIGMDKDYLPKIFEAFTQEDLTTTNVYGGSGLGMAITKNIVEMMSGNISVISEKNVGSEFTVNVTFKNSDRTIDHERILPDDMCVLVIDDDEVACEHAKIVLDEVGIASDACAGGKEALEMIKLRHVRRVDYNLILIDLKMPGLDGFETAKIIRDIVGDDVILIILTAYNFDGLEEKAREAKVDGFMSKPLFATNLLEEFEKAVLRKQMEAASHKKAVDLTGRRVLLAEDMFVNAEIMKELLNMREILVEHAENGKLVVEMFNDSPINYYDAILMDVRMPIMDGLKATEAIRALERPDAKKVPIIAMTANAFDEDVQRSLQAGMNAHLSKPVEPDQLYKTLEEMIRE